MKFDNTLSMKNDVELETGTRQHKNRQKEDSNLEREPFDWQKQSQEYNEKHNLNFNGNINNTKWIRYIFNSYDVSAPKKGKKYWIYGRKITFIFVLQRKINQNNDQFRVGSWIWS